jgi:hypothetical protein
MVGNYCENGICKQVPLKDVTPADNTGAKYKDSKGNWKTIYRHKGCWNRCNNIMSPSSLVPKSKSLWLIIFIILFIVLLLSYIFIKIIL